MPDADAAPLTPYALLPLMAELTRASMFDAAVCRYSPAAAAARALMLSC